MSREAPATITEHLIIATLGLGLLALPADFTNPLRQTIRDSLIPGEKVTRSLAAVGAQVPQQARRWFDQGAEIQRLERELAELRSTLAQRQQSPETMTVVSPSLDPGESNTEPLFLPQAIAARVVGQEAISLYGNRKILNAGTSQGLGENLLVTTEGRLTLDHGASSQVKVHDKVLLGSIVVGRVETLGHWSCTLQPIQDAKFRADAQILRKNGADWIPGPRGVLVGSGRDDCQLTLISEQDAVSEGDEVYTPLRDPLLPRPLLFGRVTSVEPLAGSRDWKITVKPAAHGKAIDHVSVLRPEINPHRLETTVEAPVRDTTHGNSRPASG